MKGLLGPQRRRLTRVRWVFFLALAIFSSSLATSPLAQAQTASCGNPHNYQNGMSTVSGGTQPFAIEGSKATIRDAGNYLLCTSVTDGGVNFSTVWVMIQGTNGHYAQVGIINRFGSSCPRRWAEIGGDGGTTAFEDFYDVCSSQGDTAVFWNQYTYVGGSIPDRMRMNVDTHTIRQSRTNPAFWGHLDATFNAETYYIGTNMPGIASYQSIHSNIQVQASVNDQWYTTCGGNASFGTASGPTPYNFLQKSGCEGRIWTS